MTANNQSNKEKIGIFGGSFNPVHKGHVAIAEAFLQRLELSRLIVVPNRMSPMKQGFCVSGEDRLKMLEIAFSGIKGVEISELELKREGMSYTCDTVAEIKALYPQAELYLLIGDDWAESFVKWKNYTEILADARLVVAARSGADIEQALDSLEVACGKRPVKLLNEIVEISSADFRADGTQKEKIPCGVYEYIQERGLY